MNLRFLICSFLLLSCSSLQPRSENAVGEVKGVFDEDEEKTGDLFLQDNGLWAYVGEKISRDLPVGSILFYGSANENHSFAIVESNAWGLVLQRLDSELLQSRQNESFSLTDLSLRDQETWPICTTQKCLKEYRPGVVFHLYARQGEGLKVDSKHELKFPRTGIARISNNEIVIDGELPKSFFALASQSADYPTRGRIAQDGCDFGPEDVNSISAAFPDSTNPLAISTRALELSVDGFLQCKKGKTSVAIPALWRAHHPMPFGAFPIAPIVSFQVYQFPTPTTKGLLELSKFILATGTGDFAAADFWMDAFAASHPEKSYRNFLKNASELSTAANRPENAIRILKSATTGHWNPENDGRWNIVRYRIEKQLGTSRAAILRYAKLPEFFEKEEDPILDYLTFFSLREERKKNREVGKPDFLTEKKIWKLAVEIDRNIESTDENKPLGLEPGAAKKLKLFDEKKENRFDVFGRGPFPTDANQVLLRGKSQRLRTIPLSAFEGGKVSIFSKQTYLFDSLSLEDKNIVLRQLIASAPEEGSCGSQTRDDLHSSLDLRLNRGDEENELLLWYIETGLPKKCEGDLAFIAAAKEVSKDLSSIGPSVLSGVMERKSIAYSSTAEISQFAIENAKGEQCETFHASLAFALYKRENVIGALKEIEKASKCIENLGADLSALKSYALFERTGEIEGSKESEERVAKAVRAEKHECPGTQPLSYELEYLVSPTIRELASRFQFKTKINKEIQFEKTANRINDGRNGILETYKFLKSANFEGARNSLNEATRAFENARFLPGLHRTRFLRSTLITKKGKKLDQPSSLAKAIMEKSNIETNIINTLTLNILENKPLGEVALPELCAPYVFPRSKINIEN